MPRGYPGTLYISAGRSGRSSSGISWLSEVVRNGRMQWEMVALHWVPMWPYWWQLKHCFSLQFISLAPEDLSLRDESLVYDLVGIFGPLELDHDRRCHLGVQVPSEPSYVFDLCIGDERVIVLEDAISDLLGPPHIHRASTDAMC